MADPLDAGGLRRWCALSAGQLRRRADEIDAVNIFPVADADTGTNMSLTMDAVARAGEAAVGGGASLPEAAAAMRDAALMDARGNSGLILSQVLAGFARALAGRPAAGPESLADCLEQGSDLAYAAVAEPREGTILSVARAAAAGARSAAADGGARLADVGHVAFAAAQHAAGELARTPLLLPALAEAGVVDAGGLGLAVIYAALAGAVCGQVPELPAAAIVALEGEGAVAIREGGSESYRHEVTYLLRAAAGDLPALRQRLARLGDSVVIAGAGDLWRVHAHVNDVGAAVEAGRRVGALAKVASARLLDARPAASDGLSGRGGASATPAPGSQAPRARRSPAPPLPRARARRARRR